MSTKEPPVREFTMVCYTPKKAAEETIDGESAIGEGWEEVIGKRKWTQLIFCEFDFAEEVVGALFFESGAVEVGIGEAMRPYIQVFKGRGALDRQYAMEEFFNTVREHLYQ